MAYQHPPSPYSQSAHRPLQQRPVPQYAPPRHVRPRLAPIFENSKGGDLEYRSKKNPQYLPQNQSQNTQNNQQYIHQNQQSSPQNQQAHTPGQYQQSSSPQQAQYYPPTPPSSHQKLHSSVATTMSKPQDPPAYVDPNAYLDSSLYGYDQSLQQYAQYASPNTPEYATVNPPQPQPDQFTPPATPYYAYHKDLLSSEDDYSLKMPGGVIHQYPTPDYPVMPSPPEKQASYTPGPPPPPAVNTRDVYNNGDFIPSPGAYPYASGAPQQPTYAGQQYGSEQDIYEMLQQQQEQQAIYNNYQQPATPYQAYRSPIIDSPQGSPLPATQQDIFKVPTPPSPAQAKLKAPQHLENFKLDSPVNNLYFNDMSLNSPRPRSGTYDMENVPPISTQTQENDTKVAPPPPQQNVSLSVYPPPQRLRSGTIEMSDAIPHSQRSRAGTVEMADCPPSYNERRLRSGTVEMPDASIPQPYVPSAYIPPIEQQSPPDQYTENSPQQPLAQEHTYNQQPATHQPKPQQQYVQKQQPIQQQQQKQHLVQQQQDRIQDLQPPKQQYQQQQQTPPQKQQMQNQKSVQQHHPSNAQQQPRQLQPNIQQQQMPQQPQPQQNVQNTQQYQLPTKQQQQAKIIQQQQIDLQKPHTPPPLQDQLLNQYSPQMCRSPSNDQQQQYLPQQKHVVPASPQNDQKQTADAKYLPKYPPQSTDYFQGPPPPYPAIGPTTKSSPCMQQRYATKPAAAKAIPSIQEQSPPPVGQYSPQQPPQHVGQQSPQQYATYAPQQHVLPQQQQQVQDLKQEQRSPQPHAVRCNNQQQLPSPQQKLPPDAKTLPPPASQNNHHTQAELEREQKLMQQQYMQRVRQAQLQQHLREITDEYEQNLQVEQEIAQEFLREQQSVQQQHPPQHLHQQHPTQQQQTALHPNQQQIYHNGRYMPPPQPSCSKGGYMLQQPAQSRYPRNYPVPPSPQQQQYHERGKQPIVIMPGGGPMSNPGQFLPPTNPPPSALRKDASPVAPKKQQTPFQRLRKIAEDMSSFVDDIVKFKGAKGGQEYKYLEEMLTQQLILLDKVPASTSDELRNARKALVKEVQELLEILERRATKN